MFVDKKKMSPYIRLYVYAYMYRAYLHPLAPRSILARKFIQKYVFNSSAQSFQENIFFHFSNAQSFSHFGEILIRKLFAREKRARRTRSSLARVQERNGARNSIAKERGDYEKDKTRVKRIVVYGARIVG